MRSQMKTVKDKSRLRRLRRSKEMEFTDNAVIDYETLYRKPIRKSVRDFNMDDLGEWNALLQALHRRDDTFYVVGVGKGEHLLLPAVSHNDTRPPKMALILPARTGNGEHIYYIYYISYHKLKEFLCLFAKSEENYSF